MPMHAVRVYPLAPHASERRAALLALYPRLQESIDDLDQQVSQQAQQHPQARRLMIYGVKRHCTQSQEFCRRGKARHESGSVCAGMPDITSGPAEA
jgi:transposase